MSHDFQEPLPDHLADTGPITPIRDEEPVSAWRRAVGLISLLLAAALTIATAALLLPADAPLIPAPPTAETTIENPPVEAAPTEQTAPVEEAPPVIEIQPVDLADPDALPTLSPQGAAALLSTPPQPAMARESGIRVLRNPYDPFTIIPDRPRSEVIEHIVSEGDTIFGLAEFYGLQPETIAWSNDRSIIGQLRPGRAVNILPVDGVYHQAIGGDTVASIAARYRVDPYDILDSEYNSLFGISPDAVLPSGTWIVVPGGQREQIAWNPVVEREGGSVSQSGGNFVSFATGEPGSCGRVPNSSGTFWGMPLTNYSWVRGFTSFHTGVDLAAPIGTPVQAANGGVVIFAGWNSWGYGNTVVLSHGPISTLYGHMSSINVRCGQIVSTGQVIGAVGNTGNSSGPHLHFEIRYLDQPQNPTATMAF